MAVYSILFGISIFMIAFVMAIIKRMFFHWKEETKTERLLVTTTDRPAVNVIIYADKCVIRQRTYTDHILVYDVISKDYISINKEYLPDVTPPGEDYFSGIEAVEKPIFNMTIPEKEDLKAYAKLEPEASKEVNESDEIKTETPGVSIDDRNLTLESKIINKNTLSLDSASVNKIEKDENQVEVTKSVENLEKNPDVVTKTLNPELSKEVIAQNANYLNETSNLKDENYMNASKPNIPKKQKNNQELSIDDNDHPVDKVQSKTKTVGILKKASFSIPEVVKKIDNKTSLQSTKEVETKTAPEIKKEVVTKTKSATEVTKEVDTKIETALKITKAVITKTKTAPEITSEKAFDDKTIKELKITPNSLDTEVTKPVTLLENPVIIPKISASLTHTHENTTSDIQSSNAPKIILDVNRTEVTDTEKQQITEEVKKINTNIPKESKEDTSTKEVNNKTETPKKTNVEFKVPTLTSSSELSEISDLTDSPDTGLSSISGFTTSPSIRTVPSQEHPPKELAKSRTEITVLRADSQISKKADNDSRIDDESKFSMTYTDSSGVTDIARDSADEIHSIIPDQPSENVQRVINPTVVASEMVNHGSNEHRQSKEAKENAESVPASKVEPEVSKEVAKSDTKMVTENKVAKDLTKEASSKKVPTSTKEPEGTKEVSKSGIKMVTDNKVANKLTKEVSSKQVPTTINESEVSKDDSKSVTKMITDSKVANELSKEVSSKQVVTTTDKPEVKKEFSKSGTKMVTDNEITKKEESLKRVPTTKLEETKEIKKSEEIPEKANETEKTIKLAPTVTKVEPQMTIEKSNIVMHKPEVSPTRSHCSQTSNRARTICPPYENTNEPAIIRVELDVPKANFNKVLASNKAKDLEKDETVDVNDKQNKTSDQTAEQIPENSVNAIKMTSPHTSKEEMIPKEVILKSKKVYKKKVSSEQSKDTLNAFTNIQIASESSKEVDVTDTEMEISSEMPEVKEIEVIDEENCDEEACASQRKC